MELKMDALVAAGFVAPDNLVQKSQPRSASPSLIITLPSTSHISERAPSPSLIEFSDNEPLEGLPTPPAMPQTSNHPVASDQTIQEDAISTAFSTIVPRLNEELLCLHEKLQHACSTRDNECLASLATKEKIIASLRADIDAQKRAHEKEVQTLTHNIEIDGELIDDFIRKEKDHIETIKKLQEDIALRERLIHLLSTKLKKLKDRYCNGSAENVAPSESLNKKEEGEQVILDSAERANQSSEDYCKLVGLFDAYRSQEETRSRNCSEVVKLEPQLPDLETEISSFKNPPALLTVEELTKEVELLRVTKINLQKELEIARSRNAGLNNQLLENTDKVIKLEKERKTSSGALHRRNLQTKVMQNTIDNLRTDNHRLEAAANARTKFEHPSVTIEGLVSPKLRPNATPFQPSAVQEPDSIKGREGASD